jgi:hypothetical protein
MGRGWGKECGGPYLTLKCWSGELEVALDVFLDGLTRGTIAFFELRNQPVIKLYAGQREHSGRSCSQPRGQLGERAGRAGEGGRRVYRGNGSGDHVLVRGMLGILLGTSSFLGRHLVDRGGDNVRVRGNWRVQSRAASSSRSRRGRDAERETRGKGGHRGGGGRAGACFIVCGNVCARGQQSESACVRVI